MKLFSKTITTQRDPYAEFKTALSGAISAAKKAGVKPLAIQRELEEHAADFRRADQACIEARQYGTPVQRVATANGIKEVDPYEQQAAAEEARAKRELREQQKAYQRGLEEAAQRERWTR